MMKHCFYKTGEPLASEDKPSLQYRWERYLNIEGKVQCDFNMAFRTFRTNTVGGHFKITMLLNLSRWSLKI